MVPLENGVRVSVDLEWRERRMKVLYEAMNVVEGPLQKRELNDFVEKTWELAE